MAMDDDVTLGEVVRRVDRLENAMVEGFRELRDEIRSLAFVPAGVYASDQSAMRERVDRLESRADQADNRAWHVRAALLVAGCSGLLSLVVGGMLAAVGLN